MRKLRSDERITTSGKVIRPLQHKNVLGAGADKRNKLKAHDKFDFVMGEWKRGTLHSSDGSIVSYPDERNKALAIAFSEARKYDPNYPN